MEAPLCKLCSARHWGNCPAFAKAGRAQVAAAVEKSTTAKPRAKAGAKKRRGKARG